MKIEPGIHYQAGLFIPSILIAVLASGAALWIAFRLRNSSPRAFFSKALASSSWGAIIGMHYTGMAAAQFPEGSPAAPHTGQYPVAGDRGHHRHSDPGGVRHRPGALHAGRPRRQALHLLHQAHDELLAGAPRQPDPAAQPAAVRRPAGAAHPGVPAQPAQLLPAVSRSRRLQDHQRRPRPPYRGSAAGRGRRADQRAARRERHRLALQGDEFVLALAPGIWARPRPSPSGCWPPWRSPTSGNITACTSPPASASPSIPRTAPACTS